MYLKGLDEIDRKIIELLTQNARISYVDIGHAVNLSRVAVKNRIHALEEKGVIEEYTTIVNPQKVGNAVSSYYEIEFLPEHFSPAVERLQKEESVTQIYHVSGKNKLHVHAVTAGNDEMELFLSNVIYQLPGVTSLSCNIILSRIKDIKGLRL